MLQGPPNITAPRSWRDEMLQAQLPSLRNMITPTSFQNDVDFVNASQEYITALRAISANVPPKADPRYNRAMVKLERLILSKQRYCADGKWMLPYGGKPSALSKFATNNGSENLVQDALQCFSESLFKWGPFPDINSHWSGSREVADIYNTWLVEAARVGKGSVEGGVYIFRFQNNPLFAIKVPYSPDGQGSGLPHEAFVGLNFLNPLKKIIPTFMHVYTSFKCSTPVMDGDYKLMRKQADERPIFSLCPANAANASTHLVVENIQGAKDVSTWIVGPNVTPADFLVIYLQVISALRIASETCNFTHYDLHHQNVLLQPYADSSKSYVSTIYDAFGSPLHVRTKIIPRIIDYGRCYCESGEYRFGAYIGDNSEAGGVYTSAPFPACDAFCFLAWCRFEYLAYTRHNQQDKNSMIEMFKFLYTFFGIDPDNLDPSIVREGKYLLWGAPANVRPYYTAPTVSLTTDKISHAMLMNYILASRETIPFISPFVIGEGDVRATDINVTGCLKGGCIPADIIHEIAGSGRLPETLQGLMDAVKIEEEKAKNTTGRAREDADRRIDNMIYTNVDRLFDGWRAKIESVLAELEAVIQSSENIERSGAPSLVRYLDLIEEMVRAKELLLRAKLMINDYKYLELRAQQRMDVIDAFESYKVYYEELYGKYKTMFDLLSLPQNAVLGIPSALVANGLDNYDTAIGLADTLISGRLYGKMQNFITVHGGQVPANPANVVEKVLEYKSAYEQLKILKGVLFESPSGNGLM